MSNKLGLLLTVTGMTCLLLLVPAWLVTYDTDFHQQVWEKYNIPVKSGVSMKDLTEATEKILDYFSHKVDSPQIEVQVKDEERPLFSQKELEHLVDVRNLVVVGKRFVLLSSLFVAVGLFLNKNRFPAYLGTSLLVSGSLGLGVICLVSIAFLMDFSAWWTRFHLLAFTNDLWLLNPEKDWLINMFPLEFFKTAIMRVDRYLL